MWLVTSLSFFFLFSPLASVAYLDRSGRSVRQNSCFRLRMCFWGFDNIRLHIGVKPSKTSPKWAGIGNWQPNRRSSKMKIFSQNFRHTDYRGHSRKNAKLGQRGSWMGHVTYFWNFGTLSISRKPLKLETSNSAQWWTAVQILGQNGSSGGWLQIWHRDWWQ